MFYCEKFLEAIDFLPKSGKNLKVFHPLTLPFFFPHYNQIITIEEGFKTSSKKNAPEIVKFLAEFAPRR